MSLAPVQIWWSAAEIAEARLPDMPNTKRGVSMLAQRDGWAGRTEFARRRKSKGGGTEFHWKLFPAAAQMKLLQRKKPEINTPLKPALSHVDHAAAWQFFEGLPKGPKAKAAARLATIQKVDALIGGGLTRQAAIVDVASADSVSERSLWSWFKMIDGVAETDRLAYLAPRHSLAKRGLISAAIDPEFAHVFKSDYLRQSGPPLTDCYDRTVDIAEANGWPIPSIQKVRRWVKSTISKPTLVLRREGPDALKRIYPAQVRDKTNMHAMEGVNGDFHRFDVFVNFPGRNGGPDEVHRPQMVAFQDVYSGRILCWRLATSANSHTVQLAIGDMIEKWGIPKHVLLDNGREFAAMSITGGTPTRNRYKIKEDDIPGLLTVMGCEVHWATPYAAQSKPIERAFRDLCTRVAKHPSFEGAYTGNKPDAKPENYGSRAVPLDEFSAVLDVELERHNNRTDRRSEVAYGRSFAEVFDESYATAPIRMATQEQRRFWLMGVEGILGNQKNGSLRFKNSTYWAEWMYQIAGKKIVARFDRDALWDGMHIYDLNNAYLGFAPCMERGEFFDLDDANHIAKTRNAFVRKAKAAAKAEDLLGAAELALMHRDLADEMPEADVPERRVVEPDFNAARGRNNKPVSTPAEHIEQDAVLLDMTERLQASTETDQETEKLELFLRARELEDQLESGESLTKQQSVWLNTYQKSDDYRGLLRTYGQFGDGMFAGLPKGGKRNV